jgi:Toprim domain/CHC2 zinc finger
MLSVAIYCRRIFISSNNPMPRLRLPLTDEMRKTVMHAAEIAKALEGRRSGRGWKAKCPAHCDTDPSLSISISRDGRTLVHCFSGCTQGEVIDALRARGLWANGDVSHDRLITPKQYKPAQEQHAREDAERTAQAIRIWDAALHPLGTFAEEYLASRRLVLPPELSGEVLRFHPACPWEGGYVPCLLAAFRSIASNDITGIHRIRLDQPEMWPKAKRMMLGIVAGSAVKLDQAGTSLVIGEGIETCLAARQLGFRPAWALGSSGGIKEFEPVDGVDELIILGERDNGSNRNAAAECCRTWKPNSVVLFEPPVGFKDLNDVLMERKNAAT